MLNTDPLIHLAFSIHSNPGAYAILLGSGISRAASIPTGYEVTLEMLRQLATLHGETTEDLEQWYVKKFKKTPEYSELLEQLGKTPTERHSFLKQFFEPTEQEKEEGKKQPTAAHRAIAKMVASGKVRVIVTTNFDRLMEYAIQDEGITPIVLASSDAVEGAIPLVHSKCTIVKVNGDYLDSRIKNTIDELEKYDDRSVRLLDQIFDEFGLLVCGWSGDCDKALRACIEKAKARRYGCYWCVKSEPSNLASSLMNLCGANRIKIESADKFFLELEDKLASLAALNRPHPLSAPLAVASLKRYISEDKYRIRLHDLVMDETNRVCVKLSGNRYPMTGNPAPDSETMQARINQYNEDLSILLPMFINLCLWGKMEHYDLAIRVLNRISSCVPDGGGYQVWRSLRLLPASLLLCAGGIVSVNTENFDLLEKLLKGFKIKNGQHDTYAIDHLLPNQVLGQREGRVLPGRGNEYTPTSNHVFDLLRPLFSEIIPSEEEYDSTFDRFEYLSAMIYTETFFPNSTNNEHDSWSPPGRFSWKRMTFTSHISKVITREIDESGKQWLPLKSGLFSGDPAKAKKIADSLNKFTFQLRWQ